MAGASFQPIGPSAFAGVAAGGSGSRAAAGGWVPFGDVGPESAAAPATTNVPANTAAATGNSFVIVMARVAPFARATAAGVIPAPAAVAVRVDSKRDDGTAADVWFGAIAAVSPA